MPNDNQNTTERRIALLRESALFLRGCPSDSNREGVIDDFPDLPRELADRVIDEAWATAPPAPPVGAGNLGRAPELPLTRAGLAKALELAGWRVRWNPVARHVEAQRVGGVDWEEAAGLLRHRMMVDTSEAATMRRGAHLEPWRIASARLEDRLLAVVASHDVADFADVEGSQTYETVLTWATATASGRIPMQISDVVSAASPLDL